MSDQSHAAALARLRSSVAPCVDVCGRAETRDGDEGTGADPRGLQPARAIRRALANGRLKAADVDAVWACFDPLAFDGAGQRARAAIELALGPHAVRVTVDLRPALRHAGASTALAETRCAAAIARGDVKIGVAVSIGMTGRNVAVALRRREDAPSRS